MGNKNTKGTKTLFGIRGKGKEEDPLQKKEIGSESLGDHVYLAGNTQQGNQNSGIVGDNDKNENIEGRHQAEIEMTDIQIRVQDQLLPEPSRNPFDDTQQRPLLQQLDNQAPLIPVANLEPRLESQGIRIESRKVLTPLNQFYGTGHLLIYNPDNQLNEAFNFHNTQVLQHQLKPVPEDQSKGEQNKSDPRAIDESLRDDPSFFDSSQISTSSTAHSHHPNKGEKRREQAGSTNQEKHETEEGIIITEGDSYYSWPIPDQVAQLLKGVFNHKLFMEYGHFKEAHSVYKALIYLYALKASNKDRNSKYCPKLLKYVKKNGIDLKQEENYSGEISSFLMDYPEVLYQLIKKLKIAEKTNETWEKCTLAVKLTYDLLVTLGSTRRPKFAESIVKSLEVYQQYAGQSGKVDLSSLATVMKIYELIFQNTIAGPSLFKKGFDRIWSLSRLLSSISVANCTPKEARNQFLKHYELFWYMFLTGEGLEDIWPSFLLGLNEAITQISKPGQKESQEDQMRRKNLPKSLRLNLWILFKTKPVFR
jgi:hypothetical protein